MKKRIILFNYIIKIILGTTLLLATSLEVASQTPVSANGKLRVSGTKLVNENGTAIQLRGMSTHGPQWFKQCYNSSSLNVLVNDWGIDVFRIAMYVGEGGYLNNPSYWRSWIDDMVELCGQKGIYCLIDWHVLNPGNPNNNINEAKEFWNYMSNKHKGKDHVLYEICNEPNGVNWSTIKSYANQIIPIIRANDPNTIVIVGTPTWSQDVDIASSDKLNYTNIMYALHFYSGTHTQYLRDKASSAIANGAALFVTEFGTSQASGDGGPYLSETQTWIDFLAANKISWINWSFADKSEVSAALNPGSCRSNYNNTSQSGTFIKQKILNPADDWIGEEVPVTGVAVLPTAASIGVGSTTQLTATVKPSNANNQNVSWSSSNTSVAKVNQFGLVSGIADGSAVITVTTEDGGFTATCNVTVTESVPGNITIRARGTQGSEEISLVVAGSTIETWTITTSYQEYSTTASDTPVRVQFSNDNGQRDVQIDYVKIDGTTYQSEDQPVNTGAWDGSCGGGSHTEWLHCNGYIEYAVTGGDVPVTGISVSPTIESLEIGATAQLTASISPSNATNKTVNWESDNTAVATVSQFGVVTGEAEGSAVITATTEDGSFTATCDVTVTEPSQGNITVRARGTQGSEEISLVVAGSTIETWTLTTGYKEYSAVASGSPVRVRFSNDNGQRDVQIDYIKDGGVSYQSEDQAVNTGAWDGSCGGGSYTEWLHCNGYIEYAMTERNALMTGASKPTTAGPSDANIKNASWNSSDAEGTKASSGSLVSGTKEGIDVQIFPVPVKELVNIRFSKELPGTVEIELLDATGRLVVSESTDAPSHTIDLSGLQKGYYMVRISGSDTNIMKTIVKE